MPTLLNPTAHRQIMEGPALTPAARAMKRQQAHDAGAEFVAYVACQHRTCDTLEELLDNRRRDAERYADDGYFNNPGPWL